MPELLQEVAGRLVSVEEGLAALDNHKTALHNNADMVKGEISTAVEHQMKVLRTREKQLIRQVEVASTHQNSEVNMTQAQLLQHKGALSVTRTFLDNCPDTTGDCTPSDIAISVRNTIATTVNCLPHQDVQGLLQHTEKLLRVPLVSVSADEGQLSGSIQRWGRVTLPPTMCHLLPHCLEEYGDVEHHVLHKSVQPAGQATPPIDVRRPYLLAARAGIVNKEDNPSRKITFSPAKEDLFKWLHRMQLEDEAACDPTSCRDQGCGVICVEEVCQANELCSSFSDCAMIGQCKKNAQEKLDQTARWQKQQQLEQQREEEELEITPLQFAMDLSTSSSRKRNISESCSVTNPMSAVLDHMISIRESNNDAWLATITDKKSTEIEFGSVLYESQNMDYLVKLDNINKKQKTILANIVYKAPNSSWILPKSGVNKGRSENGTDILSKVPNLHRDTIEDGSKSWLLPATKAAVTKAHCEKENTLCRDSMIKSQMALGRIGSIENLMEKIDKMSMNSNNKASVMSDFERKESWLLQQYSSMKADNKVLNEVMKKKSEWLSNSSLSSFTVITDSDTNSSWLMPNFD